MDQRPTKTTPYLDRYRVTGRRALITGGGRGIGLACAEALAEAGADICIADIDAKVLEEGRATLQAKGYAARSIPLDVTDPKLVDEAADRPRKAGAPSPSSSAMPESPAATRLRSK